MNSPFNRGITAITVAVTLSILLAQSVVANDDIPISSEDYPLQYSLFIAGSAISIWGMTSDQFAKDKKQHFGLSIALGATSETILREYDYTARHRWRRVALATGLATIPGIIKETVDPVFDEKDLLADVLGAFAGAFLTDLLQGPTHEQQLTINVRSDSFTVDWLARF